MHQKMEEAHGSRRDSVADLVRAKNEMEQLLDQIRELLRNHDERERTINE